MMIESTLPSNQMIAASLIAIGETKKQAAKAAKVSPQTISTWMRYPEFVAVIEGIKYDSLYEAQDRLRGLAAEAIACLASLLKESDNEKVRFDAAKYILDTIKIAPSPNDLGLWAIKPASYNHAEEALSQEEEHLFDMLEEY